MKINIQISYSDFLKQQLYKTSRNKNIGTKRRNQWIYLTLGGLLLSFYFYMEDIPEMIIASLVITLITFLFYKKYFDYKYKAYYEKNIQENYKNKFGEKAEIEFAEDYIQMNDITGESKIKNDQVTHVAELLEHFFLYFKMGEVLILPKKDLNDVLLKQKFIELGFVIIDEANWKWGNWGNESSLQLS